MTEKKVNETEVSKKEVLLRSSDVEDSKTNTRLLEKNYSPLLIRKYNIKGWPLFVGLIIDISLSDLDMKMNEWIKNAEDKGLIVNDLQELRNLCGYLNESIVEYYNSKKSNCVEGVMILLSFDKGQIAAAYGDLMTHAKCVSEFYFIINLTPHV